MTCRPSAGSSSVPRQQANVVVALMHAGAEGAGQSRTPDLDEEAFGEQRGNARAFAHTAVDAGADLVLGSGPHVLRGIELYRGRLIAYSLGNLAGYRNFSLRGDSALSGLLRVRVGPRGTFAAGAFAPLVLRSPGDPGPRRLRRRLAPGHPRRPGWTSEPRRGHLVLGTAARPGRPRLRGPRGRGANGNTRPLQG